MSNLQTKISWSLNDYCSYQCSYCPTKFWGGGEPPETKEYLRVANLIIDNYRTMGRTIDWTFNGGEPLDMNDIVTLLKLCRENGNSMTLHTNGGKLWMDWWAIEPYVDNLILTYHYWQNVKLIDYIVETFQNKNKKFHVYVPMRPAEFDEDLARAEDIENRYGLTVNKQALYFNADKSAGMLSYTKEQAAIMSGVRLKPPPIVTTPAVPIEVIIEKAPLVKEQKYFKETSWDQRYKDRMNSNPSFSGQMCNMGIEYLTIGPQGWVAGANCNDRPLGNIWHENWKPPTTAHKCGMQVCEHEADRKITKFLS